MIMGKYVGCTSKSSGGVIALSCWAPLHKQLPAQATPTNLEAPYLQVTAPTICRKHSRGRLKKVAFGRDPHTQTVKVHHHYFHCHCLSATVTVILWCRIVGANSHQLSSRHSCQTTSSRPTRYIQSIFKVYSR